MADDKDKNLEHEMEYDEEGNLKKMRLSREKMFRDRWDGVMEIRFYSKQHVQRISIACKKALGEAGIDWDTYVSGYARVSDIIKHNAESEDEMKDQIFLIGYKNNGKNDVEDFEKRIKRLKLKYLFSGVTRRS